MTIKEERQLRNYIKGLIRESINEMPLPKGFNYDDDLPDIDDRKPGDEAELDADPNWKEKSDWPMKGSDTKDDPIEDDEEESDSPAGLPDIDDNEVVSPYEDEDDKGIMARLHYMMEGMARDAVKTYLNESKKKKGSKKTTRSKDGKKKGSKDKTSSSEKTIVSRLNNDAVNSAHYFYKLYGVEDGTEDEKAAARSLGYKKAKGKSLPGKKGHYKFSSKERNRLNAMLTTDKN